MHKSFTPLYHSFFTKSLALAVLVVAAPLVGLQAYSTYQGFETAKEQAQLGMSREADAAAQIVAEVFQRAELLLILTAARPEAQSTTANDCARLFRGIDLSSTFSNIIFSDIRGGRVCSLRIAPGATPPSSEDPSWFDAASRANGFVLSAPRQGQTSGRKIVLLSTVTRGAGNERTGVLSVSIDLLALSNLLQRNEAGASRRSVTVLNDSSLILARYPEADKFVATELPARSRASRVIGSKALFDSESVDGMRRLFTEGDVGRYGLRIAVGAPVEDVFASSRAALVDALLVSLLALLTSAGVTFLFARRLAQPVRTLLSAAEAAASGQGGGVDERLPAEFGQLAQQFNRTLGALHLHIEESQRLAQKAQRQSRMHQALSATNRAIVRASEDKALFDEICGICVNFGQAVAAWVSLAQNGSAVPVSWAGQGRDFTEGLRVDLAAWSLDAATPTAAAIRERVKCVVNDVMNDPRTQRWVDRAAQHGVRSLAAVPLRSGTEVVGCLHIAAGEADFFDAEFLGLLNEMGVDVSFALDNLEREQARLTAVSSSRQHEEQLAGIIETAMDAILTIDERQRIVVFNKSASRIFGIAAEDALGLPLTRFIPDRFHRAHGKHIEGFARTGVSARQMGASLDLLARRADGTEFPIEASISRLGKGDKTLMTVVLRDVSALKAAENVRKSQMEAEAANQAKTDFLSRMSHELRTPLNAVLGFSQLLKVSAHGRLTEQERSQLSSIAQAGSQLRSLIDDVLDVSRIESGVLNVEMRSTELCALLDTVVALSAVAATERDVVITGEYRKQAPVTLLTDPVRLKQVLTNLLSNAIKYNRPNGTVQVSLRKSQGKVDILIEDSGLGMTAEQLAALFQPFNRLGREHSGIEGTGIGLALCRDLVELMSGGIDIQSEPQVGTTVTVSLPYVEERRDLALETSPASTNGASRAPTLRSAAEGDEVRTDLEGTVCYIEDNPVNALLLEQLLQRWPYVKCVGAKDGRTGVIRATEDSPDLVLLDMQLPDLTGLQVLTLLKSEPATQHLRIVALSASAMATEVAQALQAGAEDYWTKPLDFDQFEAGIRRFLRARASSP